MEKGQFLDHYLATEEAKKMARRQPSTDDLDLASLPSRLDDAMLARVQDIADAPLPPPEPCSEQHLSQCLRVMLAVLPKRNSDDVSGELFVAAYLKKLGAYPKEQISFLADKAMERCQWFPTIAECIEIMGDWRRNDDAVKRRRHAYTLAAMERTNRYRELPARQRDPVHAPRLTQAAVDTLPEPLINIGLQLGSLTRNAAGKVVPNNEGWDG